MKFFHNLTWIGICINPEDQYTLLFHYSDTFHDLIYLIPTLVYQSHSFFLYSYVDLTPIFLDMYLFCRIFQAHTNFDDEHGLSKN